MRRAAVLVTAVALAGAAVAGCGVSKPAAAGDGAHKGPLRSIVYINGLPSSPLWQHFGRCIASEAKAKGISEREVDIGGENVDWQGMENATSQAVADHTDAIIGADSEHGAAFDPIWQREHQQGGLAATLLSAGASDDVDFDIGGTVADLAESQVTAVASAAGPQLMGVIYASPGGVDGAAYTAALHAAVAAHPSVTLAGIAYDGNLFDSDQQLAAQLLQAHPDLTALVVFDGSPGAVTAVKEAGRLGKTFVYHSSEYHDSVEPDFASGAVRLIGVTRECTTGRLAVDRLADKWAGRQVPAEINPGSTFVDLATYRQLVAEGEL